MQEPDRSKGYVNPTYTIDELVAWVKAYALEHYEDGGWDVVVEAYEDAEIADVLGQVNTTKGALKKFAPLIDVWSDRQADARYHASQAG